MKVFDGRHKWGEVTRLPNQPRYQRTCRVCGRTDTAEAIVPDAFIEEVIRFAMKPSPFAGFTHTLR